TRKTVVVLDMLRRLVPMGKTCAWPVVNGSEKMNDAPLFGDVGRGAEVVLEDAANCVIVVVPAGLNTTPAPTSQSPAVKESDVTFALVPVVSETAEPERTSDSTYSPISPAAALSFVAVPFWWPLVRAAGMVPVVSWVALSEVRFEPTPAD